MRARTPDPIQFIRQEHASCNNGGSCLVTRCRRGNCSVILPASDGLCIDCDLCDGFGAVSADKRPDFVVLHVNAPGPNQSILNWFVIEMKTTTSDAGEIVAQLQAGALAMQADRRFSIVAQRVNLFPMVLRSGTGRTRRDDYQTLRQRQVQFLGRRSGIVLQRCGYDLSKLI